MVVSSFYVVVCRRCFSKGDQRPPPFLPAEIDIARPWNHSTDTPRLGKLTGTANRASASLSHWAEAIVGMLRLTSLHMKSITVRSFLCCRVRQNHVILHYTKEKNAWVSLFLGPKSMSALQSRAQTGFARAAADKIFLIFLQYGAFARCTHHNSSLTANIGAHPHRALTHSHEALGLFPTPAARLYARITVSVGLSFLSPFFHHPAAHNPIALKRSAVRRFPPPFSPAPTVKARKETAAPLPLLFFFCTQKRRPRRTVVFYCIVLSEPADAQRSM